jgi:hypothetical protein
MITVNELDELIQPIELERDWISTDRKYSELEVLVIRDMWYQRGCKYPYCTVDDVKSFWADKGIDT